MHKHTATIRVYGAVQGVGFRFTVRSLATMHGIGGWVANLPDGSVQIEATGTKHQLDALIAAIRTSRLGPGIDRWEESRLPAPSAVVRYFEIR